MSRSSGEGSDEEAIKEAQEREERLRQVFETDPGTGFQWEGWLGAGANGEVYKIRRGLQRIAVKLVPKTVFTGTGDEDDDDGDDDDDELKRLDSEAGWLQVRFLAVSRSPSDMLLSS